MDPWSEEIQENGVTEFFLIFPRLPKMVFNLLVLNMILTTASQNEEVPSSPTLLGFKGQEVSWSLDKELFASARIITNYL